MTIKKGFLHFVIPVAALLIAGSAAFFLVYGLSKLFAGASLQIIIMASCLELGKLVTVSYLYSYWKTIHFLNKLYYFVAIFVLMALTSLGIYGYLSNAYQITSNKYEVIKNEQKILNSKKQIYVTNIERLNKEIEFKNERIKTLNGLRNDQEKRLDTENGYLQTLALRNIKNSDNQIVALQKQNDSLTKQITIFNDSISKYEIKSIEIENNSDLGADVGPLKYLSNLLDIPMDKIVNWLILLLIIVFDPLAVTLVIAVNQLNKNSKVNNPINPQIVEEIKNIEKQIDPQPTINEEIKIESKLEDIHEEPINNDKDIKINTIENITEPIIESKIIEEEPQIIDIKPEIIEEEINEIPIKEENIESKIITNNIENIELKEHDPAHDNVGKKNMRHDGGINIT